MFHNRDITKEEIEAIIKDAQPREKAYYALMTQSGLRPNEVSNLKIGDLENLLGEITPIPCLVKIRQDVTKRKYKPYFTFIGQETITFIKEYFKRENRTSLTPEDYLFTKDDGKTKTNSDLISHIFRRTVEKLKKQKVLNFNNKEGEKANRNELRLYNLRKYFRNHAGKAGTDYVNFWIGHSLGIDEHYFSQINIPDLRKQYQEIAMKNLRIDTKTPDQNEDTISKLEQQNRELRDRLEKIEKTLFPNQQNIEYERYLTEHPEQAEWEEKQMQEHLKWGKEHPEEGKHQQEQSDKDFKDHEKYLTEHPEQAEWEEKQMEEMIKIHQEERLAELEEKMNDILKLLRKDKET